MGSLKRSISFVLAIIMLLSSLSFANEDSVITFNDVPEAHWAYEFIHDLRTLKITDGVGDNRFGLGQTIKRSEFVAFLGKLMKWKPVTPEVGSFSDNRDPNKWYYSAIETALEKGVLVSSEEPFRANDPITREEMAVMIVRALGYDSLGRQLAYLGNPFEDVTSNQGYITIAKDLGIITGVGNNLFKPNNTAKREEAAAMMIRMYEKLNSLINEIHGFYAISSAKQANLIGALDSVGFGWSRLEYNQDSGKVVLNITKDRNNEYGIPLGFSEPLALAHDSKVTTQLMVFAKNDTILDSDTGSEIPLLTYVLTNTEVRQQVINSIVSHINGITMGDTTVSFDGVVIDFENMKGELLKESFNEFLKELKEELNKSNKLLYVAVHPARRPGQAYFDAYDYKAIGEVSDKVILMAHDYYARKLTDLEMESGYTITPLSPIDEIYYALRAIVDKETGVQDLSKIWLQLSFDSVQWKLKDGKVINTYPYSPNYEAISQRLMMDGVQIEYSNRFQNPKATFYEDSDNTENILWYEDSRSIQAKIDLAKLFGVQGISLWRLGSIPEQLENKEKIYFDIFPRIMQNRL